MKNVLIVDDEKPFVLSLKTGMGRRCPDFNILTAAHGKAASEILKSTSVDLVVTDLRMPEMDGFELLSYMNTNFPSIPTIVMSAYGSPDTKERLKDLGSLQFIDKPVDFNELQQAIVEGLEERLVDSSVMSISICGFLQLIELEQKTCLLEVQQKSRSEKGRFYFNRGELYDAALGDVKGKEAALEMVAWDNARIECKNLPKERLTRRIEDELMALIMEGLRKKDELMALEEDGADAINDEVPNKVNHGPSHQPDISKKNSEELKALVFQAIFLSQGHHFNQAKALLKEILEDDPRHLEALLLLCRISNDFPTIEHCLDEAHRIAPGNPFVISEISRFDALLRKYSGTEKLGRCPFCYYLLRTNSTHCSSCHAFLRLEGTFLAVPKHAHREVMEKAIRIYRHVLKNEKHNLKAHYYLGIANINIEQWEEGIRHLSKAAELSPEDPDLAGQLNTVLKYLASGDPFDQKKKTDTVTPVSEDQFKGKTILIVEDSSTTRMVVSTTLSKKGYRVMEAGDGLEALSKLNQKQPDLILLDIILPKMNGYQILGAIKKQSELKKIPVIMLSAKDKFLDKVKGKVSGADDYLTKPFDPSELVEIINKHLR